MIGYHKMISKFQRLTPYAAGPVRPSLEWHGGCLETFLGVLLEKELKQNDENMIQHECENDTKSLNFWLQGWLGTPWRSPWRQDGAGCESRRVWGSISRGLGSHLGAKMGEVRAKLAPIWLIWD